MKGGGLMRDARLTDEPVIGISQVCLFFNVSATKFKKQWKPYYQYKIRTVPTSGGLRYALVDVVQAAFPDASEQTAHFLAYQFLRDERERRSRTRVRVWEETKAANGGN